MNPLHLLWIVPLAHVFGFIRGAVMASCALSDDDDDEKSLSGLLTED